MLESPSHLCQLWTSREASKHSSQVTLKFWRR